jgi:hypothetical protein
LCASRVDSAGRAQRFGGVVEWLVEGVGEQHSSMLALSALRNLGEQGPGPYSECGLVRPWVPRQRTSRELEHRDTRSHPPLTLM